MILRVKIGMTLLTFAVSLAVVMLASGCSLFNANHQSRTYNVNNPDIVTVHDVSVTGASVLTKKGIDDLDVQWGEVQISLGKYSQATDSEAINALGNAITSGIIAYFTYGTAPAVKGAVMSALSTNAPAVK